jgi:hydrogenase maturation protein HypF
MAGGDLAARRPWRAAAGYLSLAPEQAAAFEEAFCCVPERERRLAAAQIERRVNAPLASSMGRLFDAAAAVLGVRRVASYEGQAAMELEALASTALLRLARRLADPAELVTRSRVTDRLPDLDLPTLADGKGADGPTLMDPVPLLSELGGRVASGEEVGRLAAAFHLAVGRTTIELAAAACGEGGVERVALGGGVFQNALLLAIVGKGLEDRGFEVLLPERLGPNDGSISYGQAAVAAARLSAERGR